MSYLIFIFVFNVRAKITKYSRNKQISKIIILSFCLSYEGILVRWTNNTMIGVDIIMTALNTRKRPFVSLMTRDECIFLHIFWNL